MKKYTYKGIVTGKQGSEIALVRVDGFEQVFEAYAETPVRLGQSVEITVKYFGAHDLGDKAVWIND